MLGCPPQPLRPHGAQDQTIQPGAAGWRCRRSLGVSWSSVQPRSMAGISGRSARASGPAQRGAACAAGAGSAHHGEVEVWRAWGMAAAASRLLPPLSQ